MNSDTVWVMNPKDLGKLQGMSSTKLVEIIQLLSDYHKNCHLAAEALSTAIEDIIASEDSL